MVPIQLTLKGLRCFFKRKGPRGSHFAAPLISGEGWLENVGKWAITGTSNVMQIRGGQFRKRILAPTSWYQYPQFS